MRTDHFDELEDRIRHKVRGIVEDHPLTRRLPDVALRNMANCAAWGAIGALTEDQVKAAVSDNQGGTK